MADEKGLKRSVYIVMAVLTLIVTAEIALFVFLSLTWWFFVIFAVLDAVFMVLLFHYAKQRIDEIEEGIDNDVDNY